MESEFFFFLKYCCVRATNTSIKWKQRQQYYLLLPFHRRNYNGTISRRGSTHACLIVIVVVLVIRIFFSLLPCSTSLCVPGCSLMQTKTRNRLFFKSCYIYFFFIKLWKIEKNMHGNFEKGWVNAVSSVGVCVCIVIVVCLNKLQVLIFEAH